MQTLVTGVSGYVGAALVPRLVRDGHAVRGFARSLERVRAAGAEVDDLVLGDATTGAGLDEALDGVDVAYYLIHGMEGVDRLRRDRTAPGGDVRGRGGRRRRAADRLPRRASSRTTARSAATWRPASRSKRRC